MCGTTNDGNSYDFTITFYYKEHTSHWDTGRLWTGSSWAKWKEIFKKKCKAPLNSWWWVLRTNHGESLWLLGMNGTKWSITYVNYHAIIVLFTCLFANIVWQQGRMKQQLLVGGLEHFFYDFPYIGNVIKSTDEVIFFRGVGQPPTSHSLVFFFF